MTIARWSFAGLAALLGFAAGAQEVSGTWNASIDTPQGKLPLVIELSANGGKLTGTMANPFMPKIPIQNGTVKGNALAFTFMLQSATLAYKGVVDGDKLTLTYDVVEQRDTRGGQSFGGVLMSAEVLTATRAR